jgi:hypothetical protein
LKLPIQKSQGFGLSFISIPFAMGLGALLLFQGGMDVISIAVQVVPLSLLFSLISSSSRYTCRALPFRSGSFRKIAAVHVPAALVTAALWTGAAALLGWGFSAVTDGEVQGIEHPGELLVIFAVGAATYVWVVTVCYLTMTAEDAVRAENRAVEAQCLALDAELKVLRAKLHPHFLFNSLNSIAALTSMDPARAREMCINLSDFLRHSLSFSNKQQIRLSEELALVRAYLGVEQIRFSDKMTVREHIDDGLDDALVPPLLLQPLLENAVKHGVAGVESKGWIDLRIFHTSDSLSVRIENPVDKDAPKARNTGHGLAIARERLRNLFGEAASISTRLEGRDRPVFIAELCLPIHKETKE